MTEQDYAELEASIENRRKLKEWEAEYNRNCKERIAEAARDRSLGVGPKSIAASQGVYRTAGGSFANIQHTANGCFG